MDQGNSAMESNTQRPTPAAVQREPLMTELQFAKLIGRHVNTVRGWRRKGKGPKFVMLGDRNIGLRPADVDAWLASRTVQQAA